MTIAKTRLRLPAVLLAATVLGACATPLESTVDVAADASFGDLQTYAWLTSPDTRASDTALPAVVNPLNERRIRRSLENELNSKGYRKVPVAEADFVVAYSLGARERYRVQQHYDDLGYSYYGLHRGFSRFSRFGRFGPRFGINSVRVRTVTEGTLVVDIFENSRKQAIWHGSAQRRLSGDDAAVRLIDDAVMKLLSEFPDRDTMAGLSPAVAAPESAG